MALDPATNDMQINVGWLKEGKNNGFVIGNAVGAGDMKEPEVQKKLFHRISILVGILAMLIMLACRVKITDFYNVTDTTKLYVVQIMLIGSVVELCRSIQTMNSMGILRGAGCISS